MVSFCRLFEMNTHKVWLKSPQSTIPPKYAFTLINIRKCERYSQSLFCTRSSINIWRDWCWCEGTLVCSGSCCRYSKYFRIQCGVIILSKQYDYYVCALGNTKQLSIYGHSWSGFAPNISPLTVPSCIAHIQTIMTANTFGSPCNSIYFRATWKEMNIEGGWTTARWCAFRIFVKFYMLPEQTSVKHKIKNNSPE